MARLLRAKFPPHLRPLNFFIFAGMGMALGAFAPTAGHAQEMVDGDPVAGGQVYATCAACHGLGGNSTIASQPILAGQHAEYIVSQINDYKGGVRPSTIMAPLASALSDQDAANVAAYLHAQEAGLSGAADEVLAKKGELIYRNGNAATGVPNCTGCHGPAGDGIPPLYPRLSGQHAEYTVSTLAEFRNGIRVDDVMSDIASRLSEAESEALAEYIAGLY